MQINTVLKTPENSAAADLKVALKINKKNGKYAEQERISIEFYAYL